jgi:hypothetical protein
MKNIQVIDAAENCGFCICAVAEKDFYLIFPAPGQDVEFIDDVVKRLGEPLAGELVRRATGGRIEKAKLKGLHGTLFFGLPERRKWYRNKRETDLDNPDLSVLLH